MLHIFKLNGHRVAYDTHTRKAYPLSALALKMLDALTPPLTEDCPSALRYAFAKYDSHDLAEAYAELYALYKNGLLFADNKDEASIEADTVAIVTSAAAAVKKIEAAVNGGAKKLHVYIKEATTCIASSLHELFDEKTALRLILDLEPTALTDEDIRAVNAAGDVLWLTASDSSLTNTVQAAWDRGISSVHAEIPHTDSTQKEPARLAKAIESAAENGINKEFFPFTEALSALHPFDGSSASCANCWARLLCGGRCLENGNETAACDTQRTLTECAIILTDGI